MKFLTPAVGQPPDGIRKTYIRGGFKMEEVD
jgi:hypothetical protein